MNEKYFILFNARQSDVAEEKQLIIILFALNLMEFWGGEQHTPMKPVRNE